MIESKNIFDGANGTICLWCSADARGADLAAAADYVVANSVPLISAVPAVVPVLWPWLEKTSVGIIARFYLPDGVGDAALESMAGGINSAFKGGADGAQVFVRAGDLDSFADGIRPIRDGLFFNKSLSVGLDIGDIDSCDLDNVFAALGKIRADSVLFALTRDDGNKSDFVGRVYGMLGAYGNTWRGELHFMTGNNIMRIEQVQRLTEKVRPDLGPRERFFVTI